MIKYPFLVKGATIGITAPSSGVQAYLHDSLRKAMKRMENRGFKIICGDSVWTQSKAKSTTAIRRAIEFNEMMQNEDIQMIIPPWGGELLLEVLEYIDFGNMKAKWIIGYSDTSSLLLSTTLMTGIATAHGPNLFDIRGEYSDKTTAMWQSVLSTNPGDSILQTSSEKYQKEWEHNHPSPCVFYLTEPTHWKCSSSNHIKLTGRLLGGCIDIIRHLVGTPFGNVKDFRNKFLNGENLVWFLENCELSTTDLRRSLIQMKLAGWFDQCSGIMFGRSPANQPVDDYFIRDVYQDLAMELQIPILYDVDCGHVPPQITFINGAYAEIKVEDGKGVVVQHFI